MKLIYSLPSLKIREFPPKSENMACMTMGRLKKTINYQDRQFFYWLMRPYFSFFVITIKLINYGVPNLLYIKNITIGVYFLLNQICLTSDCRQIKLMKGKALRKHSLHEKTAASVLLKLFISGNEWCHTTDAP